MMSSMTLTRRAADPKGLSVRPRVQRLSVRGGMLPVGSLIIDQRLTGCVVPLVGADGQGGLDAGLKGLRPAQANVEALRQRCRVVTLAGRGALGLAPFPKTKNQKTKYGKAR